MTGRGLARVKGEKAFQLSFPLNLAMIKYCERLCSAHLVRAMEVKGALDESKEGIETREAYSNETIELNDIESFCFFLKIANNIKRLSLIDSLVMKRKKAVAYITSDNSEHSQLFQSGLKNATTEDLMKKLKHETRALYKGYRHRHNSNRIATVWFIDSLVTMSAVAVSEAELAALLHGRPTDIVCIQPLLGAVPLNATGIFEHRYKIGPTGHKSFETFELMNDVRRSEGKVHYDDLNFYNTTCDKLQVSGHKINALLEREMQRILRYMDYLNISVSNLTLQVIFDSTLKPYVTAAKDIVIIGCPSEYYFRRDHIYYIASEAPTLPVSNNTVSELLLSMGRVVGAPKHSSKKLWSTSYDALSPGVDRAGEEHNQEPHNTPKDAVATSHSPDKKRNAKSRLSPYRALSPTRNVRLGKSVANSAGQKLDLKMNVSKSCSHFELNTLSQYIKQSQYLASLTPLEVPWSLEQSSNPNPNPRTADAQQTNEAKLPGIYKSMLMPSKEHNCRGDYCHLSKLASAGEPPGSRKKVFVVPVKSLLMAKAEEQFLGADALSRAKFGSATIYNDQNLSYFARMQLERVEMRVIENHKKLGLTSIPRFNYSLLDYYDSFSRRTIYSDLLATVHVSRLYHTSPVCGTCHKIYGYFDGLRDQIVFHGRVHKDPVRRPMRVAARVPASAGGAAAAASASTLPLIDEEGEEEGNESDVFPVPEMSFQRDRGNTALSLDGAAPHGKPRRSRAPLPADRVQRGERESLRRRASSTLSTWLNLYREKAARGQKERSASRQKQRQRETEEPQEEEEEEDEEDELGRASKGFEAFADQGSAALSSMQIESAVSGHRRVYSPARQMGSPGLVARRSSVMPAAR